MLYKESILIYATFFKYRNKKLFFFNRRDKANCHECRFCCTLLLCTTKIGKSKYFKTNLAHIFLPNKLSLWTFMNCILCNLSIQQWQKMVFGIKRSVSKQKKIFVNNQNKKQKADFFHEQFNDFKMYFDFKRLQSVDNDIPLIQIVACFIYNG